MVIFSSVKKPGFLSNNRLHWTASPPVKHTLDGEKKFFAKRIFFLTTALKKFILFFKAYNKNASLKKDRHKKF
jgi:hypothetical protein